MQPNFYEWSANMTDAQRDRAFSVMDYVGGLNSMAHAILNDERCDWIERYRRALCAVAGDLGAVGRRYQCNAPRVHCVTRIANAGRCLKHGGPGMEVRS